MSNVVKNVFVQLLEGVPPIKRYLTQKELMRQEILEQQTEIAHLKSNDTQLKDTVEPSVERLPVIRLIANQLDNSGAPLIFMDVARDFAKAHLNSPRSFTTFNPADRTYMRELKDIGYDVIVHNSSAIELSFVPGDVVVLNTVAYSKQLKYSLYKALEHGVVKKLIWYMHEDWPHIFFDEEEKKILRKLIGQGKITIYIPAQKALENHIKVYGDKRHLRKLPFRVKLPEHYYTKRTPQDFNTLTFVMVGRTGEGLKGHLPILYAFLAFKQFYYDNNPGLYRNFELRFVAIEEDYLSLQILRHAPGLAPHLKYYPPLPHDEALEVIHESNITICYSLRECLPVFVFEGMAMGHPILRNDASGKEEQLEEGKNGLLLESDNFEQVVETLEKIMNLQKTTNDELANMSTRSYEIAEKQKNNSYDDIINEVWKSFSDTK